MLFSLLIVKITYTAKDGRTFESEKECLLHEDFLDNAYGVTRDYLVGALRAMQDPESDYQKRLAKLIENIELLDKAGLFSAFTLDLEVGGVSFAQDLSAFFKIYSLALEHAKEKGSSCFDGSSFYSIGLDYLEYLLDDRSCD
jgi:hypothetical protein